MFAVPGSSTAAAVLAVAGATDRRLSPTGRIGQAHAPISLRVGDPEGLIWRQGPFTHVFGNHRIRDQLAPTVINDQVQATQRQHLLLGRQVMHTEKTLPAIKTLPPETEQLIAKVERELSGIGVKSRLCLAQCNQLFYAFKNGVVGRSLVIQLGIERLKRPLVPVDRTVMAGVRETRLIVSRAHQ